MTPRVLIIDDDERLAAMLRSYLEGRGYLVEHRPDVATGLAQLMPSTAEWVVKQVPEAAGRPLTDPDANLRLGAWYLAYTHKSTGDSMHAVAAYNGGPGAVASWKRKFSPDPDVFVEQIPYPETRDYVKKVFASAWNYARLYGG